MKINGSLPRTETNSNVDSKESTAHENTISKPNPKSMSFELMFDTFEEKGDVHTLLSNPKDKPVNEK
jgi:hypothetical protein